MSGQSEYGPGEGTASTAGATTTGATTTAATTTGAADPIDALWPVDRGVRRGPKPRLSTEAIADAAAAIADTDGLEAATMEQVAQALGSTKMALYRYLRGRVELEAVMLDRALGAPPARPDSPADDWRSAASAWAEELFERILDRPWSVELAQRPHPPGPNELAWFEQGLASLAGLRLSGPERLDVLAMLSGHAMSHVRQMRNGPHPEDALAAGIGRILAEHADRYPLTAEAFASSDGRDQGFRFGVDRILDGVATYCA